MRNGSNGFNAFCVGCIHCFNEYLIISWFQWFIQQVDHSFTDISNRLTMVSMIYLNGFITVLLVYLIMILLIYPTGLIIVQMLVKSDKRIEQVFNHYGGTRLLMAMVKFTTGELRKQVTSTLKSVTHGKSEGNIYIYHWWLLNNPWSSCLVGWNVLYLLLLTEESFCYFVWVLSFNFQCCGIAIWWVNTDNVVWPLQCILSIFYCFCHYVLTGTKKTRPSSAPVSRSNKPQDVWDKVRLTRC